MLLVILICHPFACDRITVPVDNCISSAFVAQSVLAETGRYQEGDSLQISCISLVDKG